MALLKYAEDAAGINDARSSAYIGARMAAGAGSVNRLATYEAAIKSGKSKAQAAFESRDLMDFSMMGASNIMINLSDMLPFFNARMQGLSK